MIWRNIFLVRENFPFFHTVLCVPHTLWILRNFCITTFWKISVKTISLVKSLLYNWFHEIIFKWYKNLVNSTMCHTHCGNYGNLLPCHSFFANIPSNWRFTKELCYKLIWRKKICMAVNFWFFHTALCAQYGKMKNSLSWLKKDFVKSTI